MFDDLVYVYECFGNGSFVVNGEVWMDDEECVVINNDFFLFLIIDFLDIFYVGCVVFINRLKVGMVYYYIL